jgi:type III pantothenate kinase
MTDADPQIPHVLACDVGNSAIHLAVVHADSVSDVQVLRIGELSDLSARLGDLWDPLPEPRAIVASSVNRAGLNALEAAVEPRIDKRVLVVGRDLPLPIQTDLESPETVGTDRICAAVAAYDRLGTSCVVADFGSAITIDAVNDSGVFLGGAILPGLAMQAQALADRTAQLPQVDLQADETPVGRSTDQAIRNGILQGARGAMRQLAESYAMHLGSFPLVIATGGDARRICGHVGDSDLVQAIVDDLTLRGVAMAYYHYLTVS